MKRIHFVLPDYETRHKVSLAGVTAPIGPTALYSFAKARLFGRYKDARCVDLSLDDEDKLLSEIRSEDLVCVTLTVANYWNAISLIGKVKESGATVAVGGPWASAKAKQIMEKRSGIIDYLVTGEGETGLGRIIENPRLPKGIVSSPVIPIDDLAALDFSGWSKEDLRRYHNNYRWMLESGEYGPVPDEIPLFSLYQSSRGCVQKPRCGFCSRLGYSFRQRSAERFFEDVRAIREQLSWLSPRIHIFDCSDSFSSTLGRFGDVVNDPLVTFTAYVRADEITQATARQLRSLGVTKVSIGVESGSRGAMERIGKNIDVGQNIHAIRILAEAGLSVYVNLMYGIPGETRESLARTLEHFRSIADVARGRMYRMAGRIVTALPQSRWYSEFLNELGSSKRALAERLHSDDHLDTDMMQDLWLSTMTEVSEVDIQEVHSEVVRIAKDGGATVSSDIARRIA